MLEYLQLDPFFVKLPFKKTKEKPICSLLLEVYS